MKSAQEITLKKQAYVEKMRRSPQQFGKIPWYKIALKKAERFNKRMTYALYGRLLRVPYRKEKIDPIQIDNIMFFCPAGIGDLICMSPLWHIMKRRAPHLDIAINVSFRNNEVVREDTTIAQLHHCDPFTSKHVGKELKPIREQNYDVVFLLKHDKIAHGAFLASRCTRTGATVGIIPNPAFRYDKLFSIATLIPHEMRTQHVTDQLIYLLEQSFKISPVTEAERRLEIFIDPEVLNRTREHVEKVLSVNGSKGFIVFNTQARNAFLEWGYENTFLLANSIIAEYPELSIALVTSPEREVSLREAMASHHLSNKIFYYPTPELHDLFSLVELSTMVITPDTSVIHVASALQKPVVGFYPRDTIWSPYRTPSYVFKPMKDTPVSTIPIDHVLRAVRDLLDPKSLTVLNNTLHTVRIGDNT